MANFIITALQLMLPAIIAGILTIIYLPVYQNKINARLEHFGEENGTADRKPVTTPLQFFLKALLISAVTLLLLAIALAFLFTGTKNQGAVQSDMLPEICFINQPSPSMLDAYAPGDEIPGYTITEVKKQGNFEFYFYALPEVMYQGFPDGFVGINYIGSENVSLGVDARFSWHEAKAGSMAGAQGYVLLPAPAQWFSLDISGFFGYADFTVFAMTEEESEKYGSAIREKGADSNISVTDYVADKESFRLDLSEEYHMTE